MRWSPRLGGAVAAYRGGYLPEERRELERSLRSGAIVGLAATNALELGIDISGLDAVLLAGWPGTRASLWQQAGRAGRAGTRSLAVFVAADDPLDTYVVHHPEVVFGQPVEATVLDPDNPHVLGAAPCSRCRRAAAARGRPRDVRRPGARHSSTPWWPAGSCGGGPTGWYWARTDRAVRPRVAARRRRGRRASSSSGTGRVLGTIDEASAHTQVHTGAVHVHQGDTYVVTELDLEQGTATVVRGDPGWSTFAQSVSAFDIVGAQRSVAWGPVQVSFGTVQVHTQVTSFLRRLPSGEVIGTHPLDLPQRTLTTRAVWWTMPVEWLAAAGVGEVDIPGAAHAAEHAGIGMLPLVATCDRWDIGGVSTALHPDTGLPTIMVYDGHPGGAGFAERAFESLRGVAGARRWRRCASAAARAAARPACSRPSAATATSPSTRRGPCDCSGRCWRMPRSPPWPKAPTPGSAAGSRRRRNGQTRRPAARVDCGRCTTHP